MDIRSKEECRKLITTCRIIEHDVLPVADNPGDVRAWIDGAKRDIRAFLGAGDTGRRIVKDYGIDGYIVRVELPEEVQTYLDAMEWFDACEHIEWVPGPYDCTGKLFTSWYKLFYIGGRYVCYHSVACDI